MDKNTKFIGIDISKDTFDIWSEDLGHLKFQNKLPGFKRFIKSIPDDAWCVMEYSGSYYQQFAVFLFNKGINVSVINPLVIKRFIQMKLQHNKTDKSDAKMIALYAQNQSIMKWEPKPEYLQECKALHSTISLYLKQSTALKNMLHSFKSKNQKGKVVMSLKRQIKQIQKEIILLENHIEKIIKENEPELLTNLTSISGIGKKTALLLISSTNAFSAFENHKQLSAYFGLAPAERTSGTSIKGRSRITKRGNPIVRNHLFMCSFTACEHNVQCKALYKRIVDKGKSKKLALIAVCNKLLKQAFAVAKSGIPYDPYYKSSFITQ